MNKAKAKAKATADQRIVLNSYHPTARPNCWVHVKRREYEPGQFTNDVYIDENGERKLWVNAISDRILKEVIAATTTALEARN